MLPPTLIKFLFMLHESNPRPNAKFPLLIKPGILRYTDHNHHASVTRMEITEVIAGLFRALTHKLTASLPQDSELVSALQTYDMPVVGSS